MAVILWQRLAAAFCALSAVFCAIGLDGNILGSDSGSPAVGGVARLSSCLNKNTMQVTSAAMLMLSYKMEYHLVLVKRE